MKLRYLLLLVFLPLQFSACDNDDKTIERGLIAENGMVVCAHPEAARIGKEILEMGGNAMDAACAVEYALSVCYPAAGNIGGGGFWVIRTADGEVNTLDYREKAPGLGYRDMYLDEEGNVIKDASTATILASGVPGTVAGTEAAHKKYGSMKWEEVLKPAIILASEGFALTASQAGYLERLKKVLLERNTWVPPFVNEDGWQAGDLLVQTDLANTLRRISDQGARGFYEGETADMIVRQMEALGGLISAEDLINYKAEWRSPIKGKYRGYTCYSMPPPSSGGVALIQLLGIVENFQMDKFDWHSAGAMHLMIEAERRVYADRSKWLGDSDFFDVPIKKLIDDEYLDSLAGTIDPQRASISSDILPGEFAGYESEETTHFSVVDKWGNAVAVTTTLNSGFGNKIVVEGAGFLLNNEMDDFSIKPGFANIYGLIGGEANAIEPGKRMLSCMTPTIICKDDGEEDKLFMVVGSPGGSTIITSVFQTILNVIDYKMGMQEAVSACRFHHQWYPEYISIERNCADSLLIGKLEAMGHNFKSRSSIGRVDAILVLDDGRLEAGADPRGDDSAAGY